MMAPAIRTATREDRPTILKIVEAAFKGVEEVDVMKRLWADGAVALDLVAEIDGEIIGHCAFSPVTADPPLDGALFGMAPVSVAPAQQKKRVGAAMIKTGIDHCRARGARLLVVLGAPEYYSRFGFEPASSRNMRWDAIDAGDAFQLIDFAGPTSPLRRTIRYHDAFYPE